MPLIAYFARDAFDRFATRMHAPGLAGQ